MHFLLLEQNLYGCLIFLKTKEDLEQAFIFPFLFTLLLLVFVSFWHSKIEINSSVLRIYSQFVTKPLNKSSFYLCNVIEKGIRRRLYSWKARYPTVIHYLQFCNVSLFYKLMNSKKSINTSKYQLENYLENYRYNFFPVIKCTYTY